MGTSKLNARATCSGIATHPGTWERRNTPRHFMLKKPGLTGPLGSCADLIGS